MRTVQREGERPREGRGREWAEWGGGGKVGGGRGGGVNVNSHTNMQTRKTAVDLLTNRNEINTDETRGKKIK